MQKFRNIWAFFQSTLPVNLAISTGAGVLGGLGSFAMSFLAFGFVLAIVIKEANAKPEYIFYRNNGLSRTQLWIFSYVLNDATFLVLTAIFIGCRRMS
ncbi:hypothetical protein [Flavobacterium selenitireducens]|uniref:hypothetical protein n=1 Tax=Flavobacterium selenitireducens TaxID=2722704 RepID=UPI00168A95C3|nr:hypothetical protein [Flavobacterium selenitireducens]MBD3582119.1 hypothetical protein [Flavobacterium selenitireducens]